MAYTALQSIYLAVAETHYSERTLVPITSIEWGGIKIGKSEGY